jgi:hypothetical protein
MNGLTRVTARICMARVCETNKICDMEGVSPPKVCSGILLSATALAKSNALFDEFSRSVSFAASYAVSHITL